MKFSDEGVEFLKINRSFPIWYLFEPICEFLLCDTGTEDVVGFGVDQ